MVHSPHQNVDHRMGGHKNEMCMEETMATHYEWYVWLCHRYDIKLYTITFIITMQQSLIGTISRNAQSDQTGRNGPIVWNENFQSSQLDQLRKMKTLIVHSP